MFYFKVSDDEPRFFRVFNGFYTFNSCLILNNSSTAFTYIRFTRNF